MKVFSGIVLGVSVFAVALPAASLHKTDLRGEYVEARTADVYTGPCFANSEVNLAGDLAVMGWKVTEGSWQGVKLDGLSVVGVLRASSTLGNIGRSPYPVKAVLIIDERADGLQRIALRGFAQRMGGDLLQDIERVEYQPIKLSFANGNVHSMEAQLDAGKLARIETRSLGDGDHICHNEVVWYKPLTKLDHAMPAYTLAQGYSGAWLDSTWMSHDSRSSFVGTFHYSD
jgi:hypothetical protein